jgi:hypothetical protein
MGIRVVIVAIRFIILALATEALVQLWFHAAPLQGIRRWLIARTPFLYSKEFSTHLLECRYCVSAWVGILAATAYFYWDTPIVEWAVVALAIHRLSNYLHLAFSLTRDIQVDIRIKRGK